MRKLRSNPAGPSSLELGCLDEAGLSEMCKGNAATVKIGPFAYQELSVDHVIPRGVCTELDNVIANLVFLPQHQNSAEGEHVGQHRVSLAKTFQCAGLLPSDGVGKV